MSEITTLQKFSQEENSVKSEVPGLWERLVKAVGKTKLTEVADFFEVPVSTASEWKNNKRTPALRHLIKVAEKRRVSLDWLIRGVKSETEDQQDFFTRVIEAFSNQSVESIAKQLGLTPPGLYRWRNINTLPNGSTLVEIYKKTGVSIHWLLFGQGSKYPDSESFGDQMTPLEELNLPEETRILSFYRELPEEVRRVVDIQIEALWENFSDCQEDQEVAVPVTETTMEVPPNENRRSQPDSSTFNQGSLRRKTQ